MALLCDRGVTHKRPKGFHVMPRKRGAEVEDAPPVRKIIRIEDRVGRDYKRLNVLVPWKPMPGTEGLPEAEGLRIRTSHRRHMAMRWRFPALRSQDAIRHRLPADWHDWMGCPSKHDGYQGWGCTCDHLLQNAPLRRRRRLFALLPTRPIQGDSEVLTLRKTLALAQKQQKQRRQAQLLWGRKRIDPQPVVDLSQPVLEVPDIPHVPHSTTASAPPLHEARRSARACAQAGAAARDYRPDDVQQPDRGPEDSGGVRVALEPGGIRGSLHALW